MKKSKIVTLGVVIVFSIFVSFYFDSEIMKAISLMRNSFLDNFFMGVTFISSVIIIFSFLTILFLWKGNKRKWVFPVWVTLALSVIVSFLLKIIVQRQRPFQIGIGSLLPALEKGSHLIWNFSFPSFQAMLVFCAIPFLSKEFPKFKYIWIAFASLVAFSRIYFGLHFLSDVIAGGLIGYLLGTIIVKVEKENKFGEKIYKKIFRR